MPWIQRLQQGWRGKGSAALCAAMAERGAVERTGRSPPRQRPRSRTARSCARCLGSGCGGLCARAPGAALPPTPPLPAAAAVASGAGALRGVGKRAGIRSWCCVVLHAAARLASPLACPQSQGGGGRGGRTGAPAAAAAAAALVCQAHVAAHLRPCPPSLCYRHWACLATQAARVHRWRCAAC
eukprot:scaffold208847_cov16-Tisochrysis_lutea.AAC.1